MTHPAPRRARKAKTPTITIRTGSEKRPTPKRVSAARVAKGWALHESSYSKRNTGPTDGWTVSHIITGRALLQDLAKGDAEALFAALAQRHPNLTGDDISEIRAALAPSAAFKRWCHRTMFWRYDERYRGEPMPSGKLLVARRKQVSP